MSLYDRIRDACHRIEELYYETGGKCYVSFSGGKDSTVLLALIKLCEEVLTIPPNSIPAVFSNTGIELGITYIRLFRRRRTCMNKAILCGRTTADINIQMTTTGKKVCRFTLAVDDGKNADGSRRTQFIDCEAWNQSADFLERFVKKGNRILVEGRLNKTTYEKDGQKHYPTNVVCDRIEFADGANQAQNEYSPMPTQNAPKTAQNRSQDDFGIPQYSEGLSIGADDLPF